jgi:JmjC domain
LDSRLSVSPTDVNRESALSFSDILGMSFEQFAGEVLGRTFFVARGTPSRFTGLLDWETLNAILRQHWLAPPRLQLWMDSRPLPESLYLTYRDGSQGAPLLRPGDVAEQLRRGATLVVNGINEMRDPMRDLVGGFEQLFDEEISANAYASFQPIPGFDVHWDPHDIIVLQVAGKKKWTLFGQTRPYPITRGRDNLEAPDTEPIWEGTLEDGDALYMPRGCWHAVTTVDEPSLQLTIGIRRTTGLDFLEWLLDGHIRDSHAFRRDIPKLPGEGDLAEYARTLQAVLKDAVSMKSLREYLGEREARANVRPLTSLPFSVTGSFEGAADPVIAFAVSRPNLMKEGGKIVIRTAGREWVLHEALEPVLTALSEEPRHLSVLRQLAAGRVKAEALDALVLRLVGDGLLSASDGASAL